MKDNAKLNKVNPIKNDIIKVKRESNKKMESKIMEIQPVPTLDILKNESRNSTAPNKNGTKQKPNYKHLKITAKNKELKDIPSSKLLNNRQCNYLVNLLSNKMQGRSLPKNYNKLINNNMNIDIPNYSSNNIKRITSCNDIIIVNKNNGSEPLQKIKGINPKNNSIGFKKIKTNDYKTEMIKEFRENKFIIKKDIKKSNQREVFNDSSNNKIAKNNLDFKILNQKIYNNSNNKQIRSNNSFNNSSNRIFNGGKINSFTKNKTLKSNNLQNLIMNNMILHKTKRSMSSSINIPRNKLKEMNNKETLNGMVIYPDNMVMRSINNNGIFDTIIENEKIPKNKITKNKNEQEKNAYKKKNNFYHYLILKGNASYLIKNCMSHRINWAPTENPMENLNMFNFKWKELSYGIDYNSLNRNPGMKQIVNHYENHYVISNKANMFINLMKYCEQRKLSVFKYVPFTIVFKIKDKRKIKNNEKQKRWTEKLEKLKEFIQNIEKNVKNYDDIGKYYYNEEYIKDKEKRNEFEKILMIKMNKKRKEREAEEIKEKEKIKKGKENEKEKENKTEEEEKYKGKFNVYSDIFPRLKLTDKLPTRYVTGEDKEKDKKINEETIGNNTLIEIPKTHFKGKNMWVLKAVNLNRGMCIKVVNSFEQMEKVINKFKNGVDYRFTIEEMEEKEQKEKDNKNLPLSEDETTKSITIPKRQNKIQVDEYEEGNQKKNNNKEKLKTDENIQNVNNLYNENKKGEDKEEKIYNCNKILIQKYIENPLLYKGRKCDMRIWVLLTHQMKVFLFKEGHLKTCSVEYDLNSPDAFTHITNYSFQKYNSNFQKFEKGNEVPFYEFQKFIDKEYPEKKYKIKRDLMKQVKEIITLTMRSGKDKINKNGRSHQFEIFGYDFMLDSDFNIFLIEINTNPGLEISSPWIKIVVPRMLDDAIRLTVDKVFEPIYDFNKNYKFNYTEEQKQLLNKSKIEVDFNAVNSNTKKEPSSISTSLVSSVKINTENASKSPSVSSFSINKNASLTPSLAKPNNNIFKIDLDLDKHQKNIIKEEGNENIKINDEKKNKEGNKNNNNENNTKKKSPNENKEKGNKINIKTNIKGNVLNKELKENKGKKENKNMKENDKNIYVKKYISPFPVPGYSLEENLWDFVCDLNKKDEIKNEQDIMIEKEKDTYTGIRHLLVRKKNKKNKGGKGNNKKGKKTKQNKQKMKNNREVIINSPNKDK